MQRNIVEAADAERRAIERALHDGIQQDLIALSVRLQLARRVADDDPAAAVRLLDDMARDVEDALDRVRRLADSVYPSLLSPLGLVETLRAAGHEVEAHGLGRFSAAVEAAAYFFCRDVAGSDEASVGLRFDTDALIVSVALAAPNDDRLTVARQRIEALGGQIRVEPAGERSYVSAAIPSARPSLK